MYFQLLHGIHTELGKKYQTVMGRNEQGERVYLERPTVESKQDLVALFGTNKFRRLSDDEAKNLLSQKTDVSLGQATPTDASPKGSVAEAAKQGAAGIAIPPGKDVTLKFPRARAMGLCIYYKEHKYKIVNDKDGKILSEGISRSQVNDFITDHLE